MLILVTCMFDHRISCGATVMLRPVDWSARPCESCINIKEGVCIKERNIKEDVCKSLVGLVNVVGRLCER